MNYIYSKDEMEQLEIICSEYGVNWCQASKDYNLLAKNYMQNVFGKQKTNLETTDYIVVLSNLKEYYKGE